MVHLGAVGGSPASTETAILESKLWAAADALRNNMDAAEYKHFVLGLIFLKYIREAERVVARDLVRDYESETEDLAVVRGRVHLLPTSRRALQGVLRVICEYDEYSPDAPINRYLKAASGIVVRSPILSAEVRRRAMSVRAQMTEVGEVQPEDRRAIVLDRRTAHYRDAVHLAD